MNLLSLDEVDDSFGVCVGHGYVFAGKPRSYRGFMEAHYW